MAALDDEDLEDHEEDQEDHEEEHQEETSEAHGTQEDAPEAVPRIEEEGSSTAIVVGNKCFF